MADEKLTCPSCGTKKVVAYEETSFMVNTGEFYCHSVKAHDSDAKCRCLKCNWTGERRDLVPRATLSPTAHAPTGQGAR